MLSNVRKKFFLEKFIGLNTFDMSNIESISFSFLTSDINDIVVKSSIIYLISSKRPKVLYKNLSKKNKNSKEYIGCRSVLYKKDAISFFKYLVLIALSQSELKQNLVPNFKGLVAKKTFNFNIDNLLFFPEISKEVNRFYGIKGLNISINFYKPTHMGYIFNLSNFIKN